MVPWSTAFSFLSGHILSPRPGHRAEETGGRKPGAVSSDPHGEKPSQSPLPAARRGKAGAEAATRDGPGRHREWATKEARNGE